MTHTRWRTRTHTQHRHTPDRNESLGVMVGVFGKAPGGTFRSFRIAWCARRDGMRPGFEREGIQREAASRKEGICVCLCAKQHISRGPAQEQRARKKIIDGEPKQSNGKGDKYGCGTTRQGL